MDTYIEPHITRFTNQRCEEAHAKRTTIYQRWTMRAEWSDGVTRNLDHWFTTNQMDRGDYYNFENWTEVKNDTK